jgi:hypothetical protein
MYVPSTQEPHKIPISQVTPERVATVRDFQIGESRD